MESSQCRPIPARMNVSALFSAFRLLWYLSWQCLPAMRAAAVKAHQASGIRSACYSHGEIHPINLVQRYSMRFLPTRSLMRRWLLSLAGLMLAACGGITDKDINGGNTAASTVDSVTAANGTVPA